MELVHVVNVVHVVVVNLTVVKLPWSSSEPLQLQNDISKTANITDTIFDKTY